MSVAMVSGSVALGSITTVDTPTLEVRFDSLCMNRGGKLVTVTIKEAVDS